MATEATPDSALRPIALGDTWHRYKDQPYSHVIDADRELYGSTLQLDLVTFEVFKITPKGVWLARAWDINRSGDQPTLYEHAAKHFVRLNAKRRYAHPTKVEALKSFIARKKSQAAILQRQLDRVDKAERLGKAELFKQLLAAGEIEGTPNPSSELEFV